MNIKSFKIKIKGSLTKVTAIHNSHTCLLINLKLRESHYISQLWGCLTLQLAHDFIADNFNELENNAIIDTKGLLRTCYKSEINMHQNRRLSI